MARAALFSASRQPVAIAAARVVTVLGLLFTAPLPSSAAIAWVGASHTICTQPSSGTASQPCTLAAATTAGDDVVVGIAWTNTAATIVNVSGSSPTVWFIPYAALCNGTSECVATLLCHQCTAQTAITTTMSEGTAFVTAVEEYSGVQAVGITGAQAATSASPGLAMTIGDVNDWTVCAISSLGNAGIPSADMGTLRDAGVTGATSSDVAGAIVDNTASSAGSVSCSETASSDPWAATGIELRSVAPRTYIWPDCDTAHPCVVHHIDTVAAGTAQNETPNGFRLATVPSSAGNLLTLTITHVSTKAITISDNNGGNWQSAVTTTNGGDAIETQLLYICGAAAGTNVITVQLSEPPAPGEILQFSYNEVSGIAPSACFDGATAANGLTGDVQPGSMATTADGDLIYNFGEETYNFPEEDSPIGWVKPDDNSALLMESTFDKFASQVSVQAAHGTYNPTLYVNGDLKARNWNSVAAAFKASAGTGTQPAGIHVTRVMHYYNPSLPQTPAWIAFPSSGNAIVITSAYPSSGYEGDITDLADNQGDTWTRTPFTIADDDPQIYYTCFGSASSSRDLTIDWLPDTGTTHMIVYDIAGAKTSGGSSGCVGATVNSQTGNQPSSANASILGAPVITPDSSGSLVIAVNQLGIGPPSGLTTPNAVFTSVWATGMTDATDWDSGDCYAYIYTTSIAPISFDWQMANANGLSDGGSNYDGAAIEILPFVSPQLTSIAVTPADPAIAIGAAQQFAATGTYTDGSTKDITTLATWSAAPATTATINSGGLATGVCPGSATIAASMSNLFGQTSLSVSGAATTKSVISVSPNPPVAGQAATLTVTVTSACGTPTGTVQFVIDGVNNGSPATLNASGQTSTSVTLAVGSHTLSSVYAGTTNFSTSTSNTLSETVAAAATTTTLSVSPTGSLAVGSSYTLTATVTPASGAAVPTGNVIFTIGSTTQTAALNASGVATYSGTAPLAAGPLTVSAAYQGSAEFSSSTSNTVNVTITALGTTTTLTISPGGGSLTAGSSYTLSATVAPVSGSTIPAGNVVFMIGTATQTVALNGSGVASWSGTAPTTPQNLSISAVYQGSTEYSASTSNTLNETVVVIGTATTLAITPIGPLTAASSYTLSATVTPASGSSIPIGNVLFTVGSTTQTVALNASGVATYSGTAPLAAGSLTISAAYQGSTAFSASTSNTLNETVVVIGTATTLAITPTGPLTAASSYTLSATVTPASGSSIPIGNVLFTIGSTTQTVALNASGVATYSGTAPLAAGSLTIFAAYQGSTEYSVSTSNTLNETVIVIGATTSLAITPTGPLTAASPYTLSATVTPASGSSIPTGIVLFTVGSTTQTVALNASGVATYSGMAPLTAGSLTIFAAYQGSTEYSASTSNTLNETVVAISTTTTLAASANPITQGSIMLTATVSAASGTTVPSGSVSFYNGPVLLGTSSLTQGTATLTGIALPAGTDSLTAAYAGSVLFAASTSNPVAVVVNNAIVNTTTTLTASAIQVNAGTPVTLTAIVAAASGTTVPTGSVSFYNGTALLGSSTLSGGVASLTTSSLPAGSDAVVASYAGNTSFNPSVSNTVTIAVTALPVNTTTSLSIAPGGGSLTVGSPFTLTATVAPASGTTVPSGSVVFTIGSTVQTVVLNSSGVAAYSGVAPLSAGPLAISAVYQGSATFSPSTSNTLNENLVAITTATVLSITPPGSLTAGSSYTVTATIVPASGATIPTGSVVFEIGSGTQTVALNSSGIAAWTGIAPGAGTLTITATYQGAGEFSSSTSNPITETILAVPTNTTLTASAAQIVQGSPVTLTATVTAGNGATVTGSVDFYNGTALLGTVPLSAGVASLTTSTLSTGADVMNAMYEGNSTFAASSFSGLPIVVTEPSNPAPVITGISPALALAGNSAFTLTVTGSGFTSASTVNWGSTALVTQFESTSQLTAQVPAPAIASAGMTNVTVETPAPGGGTSNLFQFEIDSAGSGVTQPSFTPSTTSIAPGSTATYQVTLPATATNVSAACLNLPAGATCSYSAASGALTIATPSSTPAGTYSITVVFTETLPVAASAFALWPFVLFPLRRRRQRGSRRRLRIAIYLASGLIASAVFMGGCSGGGGSSNSTPPPVTQQVTSSGVVTLTLQ